MRPRTHVRGISPFDKVLPRGVCYSSFTLAVARCADRARGVSARRVGSDTASALAERWILFGEDSVVSSQRKKPRRGTGLGVIELRN
jgi:hypothetical protein